MGGGSIESSKLRGRFQLREEWIAADRPIGRGPLAPGARTSSKLLRPVTDSAAVGLDLPDHRCARVGLSPSRPCGLRHTSSWKAHSCRLHHCL
jgi:hypothetical protein